MTRDELAHILRSASRIVGEQDIVVIGSQSILGSFTDSELPDPAIASIEADLAFLDDPDHAKADKVDGAIGEDSQFHATFGYYGQGVSVTTALLPAGWRDRVVVFDNADTQPGRGLCLDPHDLVVSKLAAGREKDFGFAAALLLAGLVDADVLSGRAETLDTVPAVRRRVVEWIQAFNASVEDADGPRAADS
jgi:hypothetical protein